MSSRMVTCPACRETHFASGSNCLICGNARRLTVKQAAQWAEESGIEQPAKYHDDPIDGLEPCVFCMGVGYVLDIDWAGDCTHCLGDGMVGPVRAELIRRERYREQQPGQLKAAPVMRKATGYMTDYRAAKIPASEPPKTGARFVHSFHTFTTGHIGFVSKGDGGSTDYRWYLVDPNANNMAGEIVASGICYGAEGGYDTMHSAIMGFMSKLNPTRTPDSYDAPDIES